MAEVLLEAPLTKICPCGHAILLPQYCPPAYANANLSSLMAYLKDVPLIAWAGVAHTPLLCIRRVVGFRSHFAQPSTSSKRRMLARGHARPLGTTTTMTTLAPVAGGRRLHLRAREHLAQ